MEIWVVFENPDTETCARSVWDTAELATQEVTRLETIYPENEFWCERFTLNQPAEAE